jgi:hypothetical protein
VLVVVMGQRPHLTTTPSSSSSNTLAAAAALVPATAAPPRRATTTRSTTTSSSGRGSCWRSQGAACLGPTCLGSSRPPMGVLGPGGLAPCSKARRAWSLYQQQQRRVAVVLGTTTTTLAALGCRWWVGYHPRGAARRWAARRCPSTVGPWAVLCCRWTCL